MQNSYNFKKSVWVRLRLDVRMGSASAKRFAAFRDVRDGQHGGDGDEGGEHNGDPGGAAEGAGAHHRTVALEGLKWKCSRKGRGMKKST